MIHDDWWWLMHPCLLTLSRLLSSYFILAYPSGVLIENHPEFWKDLVSNRLAGWNWSHKGKRHNMNNGITRSAPFTHFSPPRKEVPKKSLQIFISFLVILVPNKSPPWYLIGDTVTSLLQVHLFQDFQFRRCTAQETEIQSVKTHRSLSSLVP